MNAVPEISQLSSRPFRMRMSSCVSSMEEPIPGRSEEHTSDLQSHRDLHSFPTRRSSDLLCVNERGARNLTTIKQAFPYAHVVLRFLHGGAYSWQVLNALELSGMFHLPQETTDLPLVRRISLKSLLASPEIARQITQIPAPLPPALIGYSKHRR